MFATIEEAEKQEDHALSGMDLSELGEPADMTSEQLEHAVQQLEQRLEAKPKDKPLKKTVRILRKD
ncbi:IS1182 family transposase, partial [Paenibacillus xanthanilyticus]